MAERYSVDRLWPDPAAGLDLDDAIAGFTPPVATDRPGVAVNMITSIDGRAQLQGTAEGLGSRADRRLMQHYRAAFDAVGGGAGTLRSAGLWLRVRTEFAERRAAAGRPRQPSGVLIAGSSAVPTDAAWFTRDEPRVVVVGASNPTSALPPRTELLRAPTDQPEPAWVLEQLRERGIGSLLLEGGPNVNAAFLAADLVDELYWTIGAGLIATDALPMVAPIPGGSPYAERPRPVRLTSVLRHGDELFVRYSLR
jgi:riboflavin biosynthesis pyrimidine reductase